MSAYTTAVAADAPLSYWRLGEASGTVAADQEGNHNGVYTNSPTLGVAGAINDGDGAITLSGSGGAQYVQIGSTTASTANRLLGGRANYSIEAWVKATNNSATMAIYAERNASSGATVVLRMAVGKIALVLRDGANTIDSYSTPGTYNDGNWHHVVATKQGTAMQIYVDGSPASPYTQTGTDSYNQGVITAIGKDWTSTPTYYAGTLDEVAIYTTALSSTRVAAHYLAAYTTTDAPSGAVGLSGSSVEATLPTDAVSAAVGLAGSLTEQATRTDTVAGAVAFGGTLTARGSYADATPGGTAVGGTLVARAFFLDARQGGLVFGGLSHDHFTAPQSDVSAPGGAAVLGGSVVEVWRVPNRLFTDPVGSTEWAGAHPPLAGTRTGTCVIHMVDGQSYSVLCSRAEALQRVNSAPAVPSGPSWVAFDQVDMYNPGYMATPVVLDVRNVATVT